MSKIHVLKNHTRWSRIEMSIVMMGTSWLYFAVFVQQTVHCFFVVVFFFLLLLFSFFLMVNRNESWLFLEASYFCFERRESLHIK